MECGIIGLQGVGKTTLFQALTAHAIPVQPGSMKPNMGMASIPDGRLDRIAEFIPTQKVIHANLQVVDIPGIPTGSGGSALGPILAHIRNVDALCQVVRCYDDPGLGPANPVGDIDAIESELLLSDLVVIESNLDKAERVARGGDPDAKHRADVLARCKALLDEGMPVRNGTWSGNAPVVLKTYGFMTAKPILYVANVGEDELDGSSESAKVVAGHAEEHGGQFVPLCARLESEVAELEEADRAEMLESMGLTEPALGAMARAANDLLGLSTFYTAGEKEIRAWAIPKGASAPEAAGAIHSDIERGFIRAECFHVDDLFELKTEKAIKEAGKLRSEGKQYAMQDGDVVNFLFNV